MYSNIIVTVKYKIRENCKQYISPLPVAILDLYPFPKFHEYLTYTFWFITGSSFIAQFKMVAKLEDKSATKDTVHNLLVALYLLPKFHECLTSTFWFIACFSFIAQFKMATMTAMLHDNESATKDTVHNLLVVQYLLPKFHECLTSTFWFIAWFSLIAQFKMATITAMLDDESATKDTIHNVLVALYLFPKFHECTTNTSRVIAVSTFRTDGKWVKLDKFKDR